MTLNGYEIEWTSPVWVDDENYMSINDTFRRYGAFFTLIIGETKYKHRIIGENSLIFYKIYEGVNSCDIIITPQRANNYEIVDDNGDILLMKDGLKYNNYCLLSQSSTATKTTAILYIDGFIYIVEKNTTTPFTTLVNSDFNVINLQKDDGDTGTITLANIYPISFNMVNGTLKAQYNNLNLNYVTDTTDRLWLTTTDPLVRCSILIQSTKNLYVSGTQLIGDNDAVINGDYNTYSTFYVKGYKGKSMASRTHHCQTKFYLPACIEDTEYDVVEYLTPQVYNPMTGYPDCVNIDGEYFEQLKNVELGEGKHTVKAEYISGGQWEYRTGKLNKCGITEVIIDTPYNSGVLNVNLLESVLATPTGNLSKIEYTNNTNCFKWIMYKGVDISSMNYFSEFTSNNSPENWRTNNSSSISFNCSIYKLNDEEVVSQGKWYLTTNKNNIHTIKIHTNGSRGGRISANNTISLYEYQFGSDGSNIFANYQMRRFWGSENIQMFEDVTLVGTYSFTTTNLLSFQNSMNGITIEAKNDDEIVYRIINYVSDSYMPWKTWNPSCFDVAYLSNYSDNNTTYDQIAPLYKNPTNPSNDVYYYCSGNTILTFKYSMYGKNTNTLFTTSSSAVFLYGNCASNNGINANVITTSNLEHSDNIWIVSQPRTIVYEDVEYDMGEGDYDFINTITMGDFNCECTNRVVSPLWFSIGENMDIQLVREYTIDVEKQCGDFVLSYNNTDGIKCYICGNVLNRGSEREKEKLKIWGGDTIKYYNRDYPVKNTQYTTVVFNSIDSDTYFSDIVYAKDINAYYGSRGWLPVSIDIDEIEEDTLNGTYNLTIKIISQSC